VGEDERAIVPLNNALNDPTGYLKNAAQTALSRLKKK